MRKKLPNNLTKLLLALNSAGSDDRHHGAAVNRKLLAELDRALQDLRPPSSEDGAIGSSDVQRTSGGSPLSHGHADAWCL